MAPSKQVWQEKKPADSETSGKGKRSSKGGGKGGSHQQNWEEDGGEGKQRKGAKDHGTSSNEEKSGARKGGRSDSGAEGQRSQLNSGAVDFQPMGPYGGYGDASMAAQYWGWQPLPVQLPLWREYAAPDGSPYYYNSKTGLTQWERPQELEPAQPEVVVPAEPAAPQESSRDGDRRREGDRREGDREDGRKSDGRLRDSAQRDRETTRPSGKLSRRAPPAKEDGAEFGPPGCNLFVFHLPDDWGDDDLHEYFAPHGTVVSAKVMKELGTGRSRGFGFVSYEDRVSAATAIKKMQGYKILGKRLKVEFKKGEAESNREGLGDDGGEDDHGFAKKNYPDDERLIGYLRAISAKNVVQTLKETESAAGPRGGAGSGASANAAAADHASEEED